MRYQKLWAAALAAALLLGLFTGVHGADEDSSAPKLHVLCNEVTEPAGESGSESGGESGGKSAGDTDHPAAQTDPGESGDDTGNDSGDDTAEPKKTGYVEVSLKAEAAAFQTAGVVLQYDTEALELCDWAGQTVTLPAPGETDPWSNAVQVETLDPSHELSGQPALAYRSADGKTGYLYLAAESLRPFPAGTETRLTTVNFKLTAEALTLPAGDRKAADTTGAAYPLDLAPADIAEASIAGHEAALTQEPSSGLAFYNTDEKHAKSLTVVFDSTTGTSINTGTGGGGSGGGSIDDFCTVVFYDWDGELLDSRIVKKGGSLTGDSAATKDQRGDMDTQAPLPPEGNLLYDKDGDGTYDLADGDVKNKEGYDFVGWVDYKTGDCTPNVSPVTDEQAHHDASELVSLQNITSNLTLKAAYNENDKIYNVDTNPSTLTERYYEVTYEAFQHTDDWMALYTTFHIKRLENTRRANHGRVFLTIVLQPNGAGQTIINIEIGNTDYEDYVFKMPWGADAAYTPDTAVGFYVSDEDENILSDGGKAIPAADIIDTRVD